MIRKEGKARWTYTCKLCRIKATFPDQFRTIERQQRHERSSSHMAEAFTRAFTAAVEPLSTAIEQLGLAWGGAARNIAESFSAVQSNYALMPPPNLPHDLALLRDRRNWGGR